MAGFDGWNRIGHGASRLRDAEASATATEAFPIYGGYGLGYDGYPAFAAL